MIFFFFLFGGVLGLGLTCLGLGPALVKVCGERERERERERALQANSGAKYFPLSSTICYFVVIK